MALTSGTLPNLLGGISQQPSILRHPTQLEAQRNMVTSLVEGLSKRPPVEYEDYLGDDKVTNTDAFFHWIDRDPTERYLLIIKDNATPIVYDIVNKAFKTVAVPNGVGYLNTTAAPRTVIRAVTVADYTFIVNQEKTVANLSDLSSWGDKLIVDVNVKQGHYSTNYQIESENDGDLANYTTPASTDVGAEAAIATDKIADELRDDINAGTGTHGITATSSGSTVRITLDAHQGISSQDGLGGTAMVVLHRTAQSFTDLPVSGRRGKRLEITGDPGTDSDNYWVISSGPDAGATNLTWSETVAPEIEYKLDPTTMPHLLVRESDGNFTFEQAVWDDRAAGDLETNPWPTFVGSTIKDVFFFKNRLGFLSGENVILSEIGEYFNFFRKTVTTQLDTDPVDTSVSTNEVAKLNYAVLAGKRLFAFSDKLQFELVGDPLTPNNAALVNVSRYKAKADAAPLVGGDAIYFAFDRGTDFSGIREMIPSTNEDDETIDITSHTPNLLEGGIATMTFSSDESTLYVHPQTTGRKKIFVYKTHWEDTTDGREKVISAWGSWDFPLDILSIKVLDECLYFAMFDNTSDRLFLGCMDLRDGVVEDTDWDWKVLLDLRLLISDADVSAVYSDPNTTVTLPFRNWSQANTPVEMFNLDTLEHIETFVSVDPATGQVVVAGDQTAANLLIGFKYSAVVQFSTPVPRTRSGERHIPIPDGDLYLLFWAVNFANSGRVRAIVTMPDGTERSYTHTGSIASAMGALKSGRHKIPIRAMADDRTTIEFINDKPYPSHLVNAGWEGNFILRSR